VQQLKAFGGHRSVEKGQAGKIPSGPVKARNDAVSTGSEPIRKTIGIDFVAAIAARAAATLPAVTITAT
jgi:hypothetical protein